MRIFILAAETSGDILGADLITALRMNVANLEIDAVAGLRMQEAGCNVIYRSDQLAVMGIIEPLMRLPFFLKMRRHIFKFIKQTQPDVFIGIDAPDFNLGLEKKIKKLGIKVVHYVSPSVWAWRKWRIKKIKKAVDLMLTLFPFETKIYQESSIFVKFIGHPLADKIPLVNDSRVAKLKLALSAEKEYLAIMPGSRSMELEHLAKDFILAAQICLEQNPNLEIITNMTNMERAKEFRDILKKCELKNFAIRVFVDQADLVLQAADYLLLTSGTVTLEGMLYGKPMVVAYKMARFNYFLAKFLVKIKYFSLPNLIANKKLVPEFLQDEVNAQNLAFALNNIMQSKNKLLELQNEFVQLHQKLSCNASAQAAKAILELLEC